MCRAELSRWSNTEKRADPVGLMEKRIMDRIKRALAIAVIGVAPVVMTGCEQFNAVVNQILGTITDGNDTLGGQIGDVIDLLND